MCSFVRSLIDLSFVSPYLWRLTSLSLPDSLITCCLLLVSCSALKSCLLLLACYMSLVTRYLLITCCESLSCLIVVVCIIVCCLFLFLLTLAIIHEWMCFCWLRSYKATNMNFKKWMYSSYKSIFQSQLQGPCGQTVLNIPPLLHVFQYYIQICVLNLSHSFTAICDVVLATPTLPPNHWNASSDFIQVLDVGWAFEPWKPKMLPPVVSRHCRIVPPEAWEVSKLHFEDDFFNSQKVLVVFFKNVRMIFSLGILDVENFQAANLSWRTTRGQMASLLVDVFKTHLHSMKIDFLSLMFMFKDLFHRFFMCFLRKTWLAWNQHHLFLWWDHWWCRSQEFKFAKM